MHQPTHDITMRPPPPPPRPTTWPWTLALTAFGLGLHGRFLVRPLGLAEYNAGMAVGVFARNFERFGFGPLRGVPVGHQVLTDPLTFAAPYLNHPPGAYWLFAAAGTAEWQLRLPTVIAHVLAAWLLIALLRRQIGTLAAHLAGLLFVCLPVLLLDAQIAHEPLLFAACFALFLGVRDSRARSRALLIAAALLGPWIDWVFGFACLGLIPLVWSKQLLTTARRLALPWTLSALSLGGVLAWRAWARHAPLLPPASPSPDLGQLIASAVFERPSLDAYARGIAFQAGEAFTAPLAILGLLGLARWFRVAPRLALALAIACVPVPALLGNYAITETHYVGMLAPLVVAGAATLARRLRTSGTLIGLAVAAYCTYAGAQRVHQFDTTFFRDLGATLTDAASEPPAGPSVGLPVEPPVGRTFVVCTNFHARYGYYIDTDLFWPFPVRDPAHITQYLDATPADRGLRFLWLRFEPREPPAIPEFATTAELATYLAPLPRRRVPELEQSFWLPHHGRWIDLREAWLVTVRQ